MPIAKTSRLSLAEARQVVDSLPLEPGAVSEGDWKIARGIAAHTVRTVLWLERGVPRVPGRFGAWSLSRELTIWDQLSKEHGPAKVIGAMEVAREALSFPPTAPITLLVFNGKGKRHYLMRAIGLWEKRRLESGAPNRAGSILADILRGSR